MTIIQVSWSQSALQVPLLHHSHNPSVLSTGNPEDDDVVRGAIKALIRSSNSSRDAAAPISLPSPASSSSSGNADSLVVPMCQR